MLDEHGEEIEFDLQRYHGIELSGLWTGELSWRRLGALIRPLPPESAFKTALRNAAPVEELKEKVADVAADYGPWSQTDMLLAEMIDTLRWLQWAKTKDAAAEPPKNAPTPYPRPGVDRKPASGGPLSAEVVDLLEYVRRNGGAAPEGWTKI